MMQYNLFIKEEHKLMNMDLKCFIKTFRSSKSLLNKQQIKFPLLPKCSSQIMSIELKWAALCLIQIRGPHLQARCLPQTMGRDFLPFCNLACQCLSGDPPVGHH